MGMRWKAAKSFSSILNGDIVFAFYAAIAQYGFSAAGILFETWPG
jgi:hypothetical protein